MRNSAGSTSTDDVLHGAGDATAALEPPGAFQPSLDQTQAPPASHSSIPVTALGALHHSISAFFASASSASTQSQD